MKVITICQKKGGNGKSTSCQNLAAVFASRCERVLVIDLDEQGNTSSTMGIKEYTLTIDEVLGTGKAVIEKHGKGWHLAVGEWGFVEYLGTRGGLSGLTRQLDSEVGGHLVLKEALELLKDRYSYCFIDTSPSMNILTLNALCASDYAFIPLSSKYFSLKGLVQTVESIGKVKERLNKGLKIIGMGFVIHDGRSNLSEEVIGKVREEYGELVFKTVVPQDIKVEEAQIAGEAVASGYPGSRGAVAYRNLGEELFRRIEGR